MADSIVLGIHWEQNSGAALFINGKLANALSQERCSRKKNDERYPYEAIERILKDNNVKKEQITQVAVASKQWNPEYTLNRHYSAKTVRDHIEEQYKYWKPRLVEGLDVDYLEINKNTLDLEQYPGKEFWQKVINESNNYNDEEAKEQYYKEVRMQVIQAHLGDKKIIEVEHTACHAAASILFNENKFKRAAVVTMDGWGDGVNHSIRILSKNEEAYEIELLMKKGTSDIARIYRYTTLLLGMKPNEHEYKIMGLAPYANKKYINETLMKLREMARVNGIYIEKHGENKDIYFHLKNCFEGKDLTILLVVYRSLWKVYWQNGLQIYPS